ncbi:MAG TPA: hypothetical protein VH249_11790 [Xanthobacteraceae bacterium]|nr:hypothetical protein [Xanthobacteraceae bacterium]
MAAEADDAGPPPMRFEWHTEGPAERCGTACRAWISAVGYITEDTARDFDVFAKDNNVRGAALVLDSPGGVVLAALELGRAIRRFDMTTTVGKTIVLPSNDDVARARISADATCESMCAFVLLGGTRRYVPPEAHVLVHMIWLGDRAKHAQEASYTAGELGLVQRDIGSIARYTVEMGGGIELLETALRVPPWEPLYVLGADEIQRLHLTTLDRLSDEDIRPVAAQPAPALASSNALATVAATQGGND